MTRLYNQEKKKNAKEKLFKDRKRTNILIKPEQRFISYLVKRVPSYISPNILTFIGIMGSALVLLGFALAYYSHHNYLFLCIIGLFINWTGDSLDGRIAYYRNIPRKWYGFSLDIIMDWVGTVLIGFGYFLYAKDEYELIAFLFVVLYGWSMIISQLRYKITNIYTIDAGLVGPTEVRIIIALIILIEIVLPNTMQYFTGTICIILFFINFIDTRKLLRLGDERDDSERDKSETKS
jgi:phosphatidylglycerophosphate synthase